MPASRPPGSGSNRAPAICTEAMASIEPIIQGSGMRSHAHTAPPMTHTARPPATGTTFLLSKAGSGYGRDETVIILSFPGLVAQLVEQWTENPCVGGSIPPQATKNWRRKGPPFRAGFFAFDIG